MNMLSRTWVVVLITTILFSTVHARDRSYIVDEMTGLGGLFTRGEDVNERGQAVGYSQDTTQVPFAMYWDAGEATVIGPGYATAINQVGQVVGMTAALGRPWMWKAGDSTPTMLPLPIGSNYASPFAVNNSGTVAGALWRSAQDHSVYMVQDGVAYDLGVPLGYQAAIALGINEPGQLAVTAYRWEGQLMISAGFKWVDGLYYEISAEPSVVNGINNAGAMTGTLLGFTQYPFNGNTGFVHIREETTPLCENGGGTTAINASGDVVCGSQIFFKGDAGVYLWDLLEPSNPWVVGGLVPQRISNNRIVVGFGVRSDIPCIGQCLSRAFIARPISVEAQTLRNHSRLGSRN